MTKLVELAKKNIVLGIFIRIACFLGMELMTVWFELRGFLRKFDIGGKNYKKLKEYKNKYNGKRCFIIATGPSLTMHDLEAIKGEISFGMNSICKKYNDITFRPTFYGIQDYMVYSEMNTMIHEEYDAKDNIFISDRITHQFKDIDHKWNVFPLNYSYNAYNRWFKNIFNVSVSGDIYRCVYDGFSITISLLQIAMYMGFSEIYLLGADCNFIKGNLHFVEYSNTVDTTIDTAAERNLAGYRAVKKYADANGIKIYNATRGGKLEVFERVNFDEIIKR